MNPHASHSVSLIVFINLIRENSSLIRRMAWREIVARYKGSALGLVWSFFNPILMLLIYTFVFTYVFKARWGIDVGGNDINFSVVLFIGLIIHIFFSEVIGQAPNLILNNANYVKKVVFPLEMLSVISLTSALFNVLVSFIVLLIAYLVLVGIPFWTSIYIPVTFLPIIPLTLGLGWLIAALGVYLRDISQFIGVLITALLFLSPVLYPVSALPESIQSIIYFNPLTFPIEQSREVIIYGQSPNWSGIALYSTASLIVCYVGFFVFQKVRKGFADVI